MVAHEGKKNKIKIEKEASIGEFGSLDLSLCALPVIRKEQIPDGKVAGRKDACHLQNSINLGHEQQRASKKGAHSNEGLVGRRLPLQFDRGSVNPTACQASPTASIVRR